MPEISGFLEMKEGSLDISEMPPKIQDIKSMSSLRRQRNYLILLLLV